MQALQAQSRRPGSVKTPPLDDVRLAPAAAVPAVAEWTVDELRRLAQSRQTPPESAPVSEAETPPPLAPAKRKTAGKGVEGGAGPAIVAALAAGRAPALRQRIEGPLREVEAQAARRVQAARARAVQLAGEVLAAAQRAGWSTDDAWSRLASVVVDLRAAESVEDLCAALFAFVQRIEPPDRGDQKEDEAFRRLIDSEPGAAPTLEQLADALDMRPEALRGRIARKYGMSFSRFRGTLQVEEAKRLLRDTSLSLAQTARRVGINDGANLRKLFWKFEGMPPSEYRRRFGRK
jgi:AraC-like DNA-binding protein